MQSVTVRKQTRTFSKELPDGSIFRAKVRWDDHCGNGHNTFAITGELYEPGRRVPGEAWLTNSKGERVTLVACGCLHEEVARHFPELAPLLRFHLVSADGPLHYVANTGFWVERGNLKYARSSAVWPDATLEQLADVDALKARLPSILADLRAAVGSLGFVY
jgi:hypothetical protein